MALRPLSLTSTMGNCCGGTAVVEHVQDVQWGRAHPAIKIRGAKAKMSTSDYAYRCAVADVVMHDGQHFCEFRLVEGDDFKIGVVRPEWGAATNEKTSHMKDPHLEHEHCASSYSPPSRRAARARTCAFLPRRAMLAKGVVSNLICCVVRDDGRLLRRQNGHVFPGCCCHWVARYAACSC